jgi:hypothetical protein
MPFSTPAGTTEPDPTQDIGVQPVDLTMAAFVLPPIISILNQRKWQSEVKALVALLICACYSAGVTVLRGEMAYGWQQWRNALLQVCLGTFVSYKMFWIPSGLATRIENATSIPPTTPQQDQEMPPPTLQDLPVHGREPTPADEVSADAVTRPGDAPASHDQTGRGGP